MDAFVFIAVIWLIVSSFSKAAKQKQKPKKNPFAQAFEALGQSASGHPYAPPAAAGSPSVFYPVRPQATSAPAHQDTPKPRFEKKPSPGEQPLSQEGEDPCHAQMFQRPERVVAVADADEMQESEGLTLSFTQDSLVQAVVMQEILTRPCQRQRRLGH